LSIKTIGASEESTRSKGFTPLNPAQQDR